LLISYGVFAHQSPSTFCAFQLNAKGNIAMMGGKYNEAMQYYSSAIRLDSSQYILYENRCKSYLLLRDGKSALDDAIICVTMNPYNATAYALKGDALRALERFNDAILAYQDGLLIVSTTAHLSNKFG
jgi:stress-induced-phosphoprotein 1